MLAIAIVGTQNAVFMLPPLVVEIHLWVVVAVATVGGTLLAVTMPALVAASTEYSGDSKSSGASILGLSNQSGGFVGAAIAGVILATSGFAGIGYMCLAVTAASGVLAALLGRHLRRVTG